MINDKEKKWHDKNVFNNRVSIVVEQCGSTAGDNGPFVLFGMGIDQNINRMFTPKRLIKHYGLPEVSIMLLNKKGYVNDGAWVQVVKAMTPGICKKKKSVTILIGQPF